MPSRSARPAGARPAGAGRSSATDWAALVGPVTRDGGDSLKQDLYRRFVDRILSGQLGAGLRLPSSRILAEQLGLSRNTVVQCYDHLVDEGYVSARPRSGLFVAENARPLPAGPNAARPLAPPTVRLRTIAIPDGPGEDSSGRGGALRDLPILRKTSRWRACRYPFVYGQFDAATFPIRQWRECERETLSMGNIANWAADPYDADSPLLIDQLLTRILPRRGIWTDAECVLATGGAQNAIFTVAQLVAGPGTRCIVEDPCYPDGKAVLKMRGAEVIPVPVDDEGIRVDLMPEGARVILVTPTLHYPTTATLSQDRRAALYAYARRNDALIIEDDYDSEIWFADRPPGALKSHDPDERIIYIGSFSKNLAPGLRVGFIVPPRRMMGDLRLMRRLIMRSPPMNNQHSLGKFIEQGYYDSHARRLGEIHRRRAEILTAAIAAHLPEVDLRPPRGGSAFWLRLPDGASAAEIGEAGIGRGLYCEIGDWFFAAPPDRSFIRLGFSSITEERIEAGLRILAGLLADFPRGRVRHLS